MINVFQLNMDRKIIVASQNIFLTPQLHPTRKLNEHVISYVIKGGWKLDIDSEIITANEDSIFIQPANITHTGIKNCPPGTQTMFIHFTSAKEDMRIQNNERELNQNSVCINTLTDVCNKPEIKRIFAKIISEYKKNETKALSYLNVLLCELSEDRDADESKNTLAENIRKLLNDPTVNLANKEIASKLEVSIRTAETSFKELYGVTIHQYQLVQKIDHSKFYLKYYPQMKLSDIASNLGFYDEFHFSRQFKKHTGVSPTEYKKTQL